MDQSERRDWYDAITVVQNATWLIQTDQSETWMETRLTHSNGPIKNLDGNEAHVTLGLDVTSCKCHSRRQFPVNLSRADQSQPFWWKLTNNCLSHGRDGAFFLLLLAVWLEGPHFFQDGERWWCFMSERTSKILLPFEIAKHRLQAGGCLRRCFPRKDWCYRAYWKTSHGTQPATG